jgi:integrase
MPIPKYNRGVNYQYERLTRQLGWEKHLSTHCGRKTFAVTMCAELGINLEMCAELMGITVVTCAKNYYRITNDAINKEIREKWANVV